MKQLKIIKQNPRLLKPIQITINYVINNNGRAEINIISDGEISEQKEVIKNIHDAI